MEMTLPPIDIATLKPETRDWLLAAAATEGRSPLDVLRSVLDARAIAAGFVPPAVEEKKAA